MTYPREFKNKVLEFDELIKATLVPITIKFRDGIKILKAQEESPYPNFDNWHYELYFQLHYLERSYYDWDKHEFIDRGYFKNRFFHKAKPSVDYYEHLLGEGLDPEYEGGMYDSDPEIITVAFEVFIEEFLPEINDAVETTLADIDKIISFNRSFPNKIHRVKDAKIKNKKEEKVRYALRRVPRGEEVWKTIERTYVIVKTEPEALTILVWLNKVKKVNNFRIEKEVYSLIDGWIIDQDYLLNKAKT
ncbi:hypothetical protein ACOKFD_16265 [Flagellimonas sp. S174]|uniref:hypothetical protein n=1 Tax=Flagellimonas sp. S174 TaxID=3410790 RepID=UPI003BF46229